MAAQKIGHTRVPFDIPVPPDNALANGKDILEARNAKGKLYRFYSAAKIEEFRLAHELTEDAKQKKYDDHKAWEKQKEEKAARHLADLGLNWNDPALKSRSDLPRELLQDAGIEHPGVLEMLLRNTKYACEIADVPHNGYSYRFGVVKQYAEKCAATGVEASLISNVRLLPDEEFVQQDEPLFLKTELDFIYTNYVAFVGHYANQPHIDWLQARQVRFDLYGLLKDVFGVSCGELQREMCDFVSGDKSSARFLPREYTHLDMQQVLRAYGGSDGKLLRKMLKCFRAAGKTTVGIAHVIQNILLTPCFRAMVVVESKGSAEEILIELRSRLEVRDFGDPDKFASLFPEHCIAEGSAKTNFRSPMRRLKLKGPTVAVSSPNSSNSSAHMDLLYWDDFLGNTVGVSDDPKRHETLLKKGDLQLSLLDGWGTHLILCTPYQAGDIYSVIEKRYAARGTTIPTLRIPVWVVKPEFADIEKRFPASLSELQEDMVQFRETTGRVTFQQMKDLAQDSWVDFKRQRLVMPSLNDGRIAVIFSEEDLNARVIHSSRVPMQAYFDSHVFIDPSHFGQSIQADETAITMVSRHFDVLTGITQIFVWDVEWTKDQPDSVAEKIAFQMQKATYKGLLLKQIAVEGGPANLLFKNAIIEAARVRNYGDIRPLLKFFDKDKVKSAKANRIKAVQLLVKNGEISFVGGDYINGLFEQFLNFNGDTTGKGRKDDRIDAIALAVYYLHKSRIISATLAPKRPPLGTPAVLSGPDGLPRRMTEAEQIADSARQTAELERVFEAGERDRNRAALDSMRLDRARIERGQSTSMTESEWQQLMKQARNPRKPQAPETSEWTKSPFGGFMRTPINASTKRDASGNPVNRYGVPQKK